jgi:hypothetical protein
MKGRQAISGFVAIDGVVYGPVTGYYCQNGSNVDGRRNSIDANGDVGPGPEATDPMYFAPDVGYSMGREKFHATREGAVAEARVYIAEQRAYLARLEAELA